MENFINGCTIIILSDGETWDNLEGCEVITLTEKGHEKLEQGADPKSLEPVEDFLPNSAFSFRQ